MPTSHYRTGRSILDTAIASEFGAALAGGVVKVAPFDVPPEKVAEPSGWPTGSSVMVLCNSNGTISPTPPPRAFPTDAMGDEVVASFQTERVAYDLYLKAADSQDAEDLADALDDARLRLLTVVGETGVLYSLDSGNQWTCEWSGASEPRAIGMPYAGTRVLVDFTVYE